MERDKAGSSDICTSTPEAYVAASCFYLETVIAPGSAPADPHYAGDESRELIDILQCQQKWGASSRYARSLEAKKG